MGREVFSFLYELSLEHNKRVARAFSDAMCILHADYDTEDFWIKWLKQLVHLPALKETLMTGDIITTCEAYDRNDDYCADYAKDVRNCISTM